MRAPLFWRFVALSAALSLAHTALAADPTSPAEIEARGIELYENGAILYDEGRYEDAILAWQEGYRLTSRPGFLFNIANAQERLGDYKAAIDTLGRYRALAKTEERETLDRRIRNLEDRMAATPAPVPESGPVKEPKDHAPVSTRPIVGAGLVGLGAVGLVTGSVFGLQSKSAGTRALDLCQDGGAGPLCPVEAEPLLAANRRRALAADIGFGVGAASSVGGALLLLLGSDREDKVTLLPTISGLAVRVVLP